MSFEESLVLHASPTLASIKVANLYSFKFKSVQECEKTIDRFNLIMNPRGIYIELLNVTSDIYLIYVYRKSQLQIILNDSSNQIFLQEYGYSSQNGMDEVINNLKRRLQEEEEFPHEIGVFLGYPLADVKAFIKTKGKNCALCGDWKAYHNEEVAKCLFCKYKHCREVYIRVYREGRKLRDMLVSA